MKEQQTNGRKFHCPYCNHLFKVDEQVASKKCPMCARIVYTNIIRQILASINVVILPVFGGIAGCEILYYLAGWAGPDHVQQLRQIYLPLLTIALWFGGLAAAMCVDMEDIDDDVTQ